MLKIMVGELNLVAAMPGAQCTAHPRIVDNCTSRKIEV
jgi:hypothetical protein